MGLDAVVYRNRKHLKLGPDEKLARLVPETGEVYFDNDELSRKHAHQVEAVGHSLGNIAAISALREEAKRLIGPESVILQKILYSGTHGGDIIQLDSLPGLAAGSVFVAQLHKQRSRAVTRNAMLRRFPGKTYSCRKERRQSDRFRLSQVPGPLIWKCPGLELTSSTSVMWRVAERCNDWVPVLTDVLPAFRVEVYNLIHYEFLRNIARQNSASATFPHPA